MATNKDKFMEWDDSDVQQKLEEIRDLTDDPEGALGAAVYEGAAKVALDAGKMTPVDTGNLRGSTYVNPPEGQGGDIEVKMGQGAEYAAARHSSDNPGNNARSKAHWWRKAIGENSGSILKKIAIRAEENMKRGKTFGRKDIDPKISPSNRRNPSDSTWSSQ